MSEDGKGGQATDAAHPKVEDFEPWIGKAIDVGGTGVALVLDEIERMATALPSGRHAFVLIFSGDPVLPPDPGFLDEGIYACGPAGEPTRTIHIAPIRSRTSARQDYQAVFA